MALSDSSTARPAANVSAIVAPIVRRGDVRPTADGKGGATTLTASMPLTLDGLKELRQPYLGEPEFRGAWITRFMWIVRGPDGVDVAGTQSKISRMMGQAKSMGFNAVLFQVRSEAATFYPSSLEPWSHLMDGKDPGTDLVKYAISEAHKNGLEFHAYINLATCSEESSAPTAQNHVWHKHCLPNSRPNWLVYNDGKPLGKAEYHWFNLNLPDVQTYLREVVVDFARRYDVDGIHFDRIRFPTAAGSDDRWSKARYNRFGNPGKLEYADWQRNNVTRLLTDIYGALMEVKPSLNISAAVWGIYDKTKLPQGRDKLTGYGWTSSGLQNYNQDSIAWANAGAVDALVPMAYWEMGQGKPDYDEVVFQFVEGINNGRHVYGGLKVFDGPEMLREVVATNLMGAQGVVPFTLSEIVNKGLTNFWATSINPIPAATPKMPWKEEPTVGYVLVTVKGAGGNPVVDAVVKVPGQPRVWLSSADGFCAIIDAPPGQMTLQASRKGQGYARTTVDVEAGKTTRVVFDLRKGAGNASDPIDAPDETEGMNEDATEDGEELETPA